jgi:hypothetical protein
MTDAFIPRFAAGDPAHKITELLMARFFCTGMNFLTKVLALRRECRPRCYFMGSHRGGFLMAFGFGRTTRNEKESQHKREPAISFHPPLLSCPELPRTDQESGAECPIFSQNVSSVTANMKTKPRVYPSFSAISACAYYPSVLVFIYTEGHCKCNAA